MFKFKMTADRHNAVQILNYCILPVPCHFSLPSTFNPDPRSCQSWIRDPGLKKPDPGSWKNIPDQQHCLELSIFVKIFEFYLVTQSL
jgi:hypothetical protein